MAHELEIGWAELGVGSIVPASGAGGLALGAWILHRDGMPGDHIARRSVAFFLIKSSVNFVAVAVLGALMALGRRARTSRCCSPRCPRCSLSRDRGGLRARRGCGPDRRRAGRVRGAWSRAGRALVGGIGEASRSSARATSLVLARRLGYWLFDNAVLWATFHAVGAGPPIGDHLWAT